MRIVWSEEYLNYALQFTETEISLRNYFKKWLPTEIIDCHAHANLLEHVGELEEAIYFRPFCSFPDFNLENSKKMQKFFYPDKKVHMLRFAHPYRGINHREANEYLLKNIPATDRVALYGLPDDIDYTIKQLSDPKVSALKSYYLFFNPPARDIYHFFPPPVLEEAQFRRLPIILHLPQKLSFSINQLTQLFQDFPRLFVVLAHLGTYTERFDSLREAYRFLAKYETLYLDTSMVFWGEAIKLALKFFGEERVLYGSDEPLNYLRVRMYENPTRGFRLISEYPYHWLSPEEYQEYKHLAHDAIHAHWQTLLAIKSALEEYDNNLSAKEKIFFKNSKELFSF